MVAGRADERVSRLRLAAENSVRGRERRSSGGQSGLPRPLAHGRRPREDTATGRTELADRLDVVRVVERRELAHLSVASLAAANVRRERSALEDRLHVPDAHGVLRMEFGHIHERGRRMFEDAAAGFVQERVVVPEEVERQADPFAGSGRWSSTVNWAAARVTRQSPAARR